MDSTNDALDITSVSSTKFGMEEIKYVIPEDEVVIAKTTAERLTKLEERVEEILKLLKERPNEKKRKTSSCDTTLCGGCDDC